MYRRISVINHKCIGKKKLYLYLSELVFKIYVVSIMVYCDIVKTILFCTSTKTWLAEWSEKKKYRYYNNISLCVYESRFFIIFFFFIVLYFTQNFWIFHCLWISHWTYRCLFLKLASILPQINFNCTFFFMAFFYQINQ